jgi:hypothetical protein
MVWRQAVRVKYLLAATVFSILSACAMGSPSGVYAGKAPNAAVLLQIVRGQGGQLGGRFEEVVLQDDGQITHWDANITGIIDGSNVVINVQPSGDPFDKATVSGNLQWGHLHVSGDVFGKPLTLELDRSNESAFDSQTSALSKRGAQIVAARAKAATERNLAILAANKLQMVQQEAVAMQAFSARVERGLPQLPVLEARYREITAKMRGGLERERSIVGNGQASVARAQLSVALHQAAIAASNLQMGEAAARRDFINVGNSTGQGNAVAEAACADARAGRLGLMSIDTWNLACANLADARHAMRGEIDKARAAFAEIDSVWAAERANQEAIVKASDQAEN